MSRFNGIATKPTVFYKVVDLLNSTISHKSVGRGCVHQNPMRGIPLSLFCQTKLGITARDLPENLEIRERTK